MNKKLELIKLKKDPRTEGMYSWRIVYYEDREVLYDAIEMETHDNFRHFCNQFGYKEILKASDFDQMKDAFAARGVEVVFKDAE